MPSLEYHQDVDLFRDAISFTESETGFSGRLIEKDYYCSVVLEDLSSSSAATLAFKGGTSLSKIHGDFYRLSEDLDFGISMGSNASRTERSRRVDALKEYWAELSNRLSCLQLVDALRGYNNSTQYIGRVCLLRRLATFAERWNGEGSRIPTLDVSSDQIKVSETSLSHQFPCLSRNPRNYKEEVPDTFIAPIKSFRYTSSGMTQGRR